MSETAGGFDALSALKVILGATIYGVHIYFIQSGDRDFGKKRPNGKK